MLAAVRKPNDHTNRGASESRTALYIGHLNVGTTKAQSYRKEGNRTEIALAVVAVVVRLNQRCCRDSRGRRDRQRSGQSARTAKSAVGYSISFFLLLH